MLAHLRFVPPSKQKQFKQRQVSTHIVIFLYIAGMTMLVHLCLVLLSETGQIKPPHAYECFWCTLLTHTRSATLSIASSRES